MLLGNCQSQSGAALCCPCFTLLKRLKDGGLVLGGDSDAGVDDFKAIYLYWMPRFLFFKLKNDIFL